MPICLKRLFSKRFRIWIYYDTQITIRMHTQRSGSAALKWIIYKRTSVYCTSTQCQMWNLKKKIYLYFVYLRMLARKEDGSAFFSSAVTSEVGKSEVKQCEAPTFRYFSFFSSSQPRAMLNRYSFRLQKGPPVKYLHFVLAFIILHIRMHPRVIHENFTFENHHVVKENMF